MFRKHEKALVVQVATSEEREVVLSTHIGKEDKRMGASSYCHPCCFPPVSVGGIKHGLLEFLTCFIIRTSCIVPGTQTNRSHKQASTGDGQIHFNSSVPRATNNSNRTL